MNAEAFTMITVAGRAVWCIFGANTAYIMVEWQKHLWIRIPHLLFDRSCHLLISRYGFAALAGFAGLAPCW